MQSVLQKLRLRLQRPSDRFDGIIAQVLIVLLAVAVALATGASA